MQVSDLANADTSYFSRKRQRAMKRLSEGYFCSPSLSRRSPRSMSGELSRWSITKRPARVRPTLAPTFPRLRISFHRVALAAEEYFCDVEHLHGFSSWRGRDAVSHHVQTKRACRCEGACAGCDGFLRPQDRNALRRRLLKPHPTATRTAAEGLLTTARHFAVLRIVSSTDDRSCRIHFSIDAS